jgi:methionine-rich copper-binding protein CopC
MSPIRFTALLAAPLLLPVASHAHALLTKAQPAVGTSVSTAPTSVSITYSEGVEPRFSTITVTDRAGQRVDKNDPHLVGGDNTHLAVDLPTLPPGSYKVQWHATSVDTHKTEGSFQFSITP